MIDRTAVQCLNCGVQFHTSVRPRTVERVRRCGFCGEPALVVLTTDDAAARRVAARRRAMVTATRALAERSRA